MKGKTEFGLKETEEQEKFPHWSIELILGTFATMTFFTINQSNSIAIKFEVWNYKFDGVFMFAGSAGDVLEDDPVGRLKVFVYELPSKYNKKILQKDQRCLNHMFAAEIYMHRFLLSSPVRTLNPEEADWFYTPVYTTCDLTPNGLPLPFKSPRMMRSAIQLISSKWPYWNRTEGADHFFLVPHDFGACFHYQVLPYPPLFSISCTVLYDNRPHFLTDWLDY